MFHYENKFHSLLFLMTFQYVLLEYASLSAICPVLESGCRTDPMLCANVNGFKIRLCKNAFHELSSVEPTTK